MLAELLNELETDLQKKVDVLEQLKRINDILNQKLSEASADSEEIDFIMAQRDNLAEDLDLAVLESDTMFSGIQEASQTPQFREQVQKLQSLIAQITDGVADIQSQELQLKNTMNHYLAAKRNGLADSRRGLRAVRGYIQQGQTIIGSESLYMDAKK